MTRAATHKPAPPRHADAPHAPDNAWADAPAGARLYLGDWLDAAQSLPQTSIDLIYADPPFATGRHRSLTSHAFPDAWPSINHYLAWLEQRLAASLGLLKPTGSILLHLDHRAAHHARVILERLLSPDHFVNHLVWSYGLGGSSPRRFARKHDDILFYAAAPDAHYFEPPRVPATSRRLAGRTKKATDVLDIPALNNMAAERTGYPTQKPLELLRLLVAACSPPGGAVLDPTCGSGTTLVAAAQLGRTPLGADRNHDAIALTNSRLARLDQPRGAPAA